MLGKYLHCKFLYVIRRAFLIPSEIVLLCLLEKYLQLQQRYFVTVQINIPIYYGRQVTLYFRKAYKKDLHELQFMKLLIKNTPIYAGSNPDYLDFLEDSKRFCAVVEEHDTNSKCTVK